MPLTTRRLGDSTSIYRFIPLSRLAVVDEDPLLSGCAQASKLTEQKRRTIAELRLSELLEYAVLHVPRLCHISLDQVREKGLAAFPIVGKMSLSETARAATRSTTRVRWNRTSGSTNIPSVNALGDQHEYNQITKWLRVWHALDVTEPCQTYYLVPRVYRVRSPGGEPLIDLAGRHLVEQFHPGNPSSVPAHAIVVANPHVLELLYPRGWPEPVRLWVNAYEQIPPDTQRWPADQLSDAWGLSEVGDCAWRSEGGPWQIHNDLVYLELLGSRHDETSWFGELVITDLTNRVMPIIRYRTGDLGVAELGTDGRVERLLQLNGRRILARGTVLSGVDVMTHLLPPLLDLGSEFRILANDSRVEILLIDSSVRGLATVAQRIRARVPQVELRIRPFGRGEPKPVGMREVFRSPSFSTGDVNNG